MSKAYQGRSKGDIALDNLMRDAKNARNKERNGIVDETILTRSLSCNKPNIHYHETPKDSELTRAALDGYANHRNKQRLAKKQAKFDADKAEADLVQLAEDTGIYIELLRKNPNLRRINPIV